MKNRPSDLIYFDDDSYFPRLSEEFKGRIEAALALLQPYAQPVIDSIPNTVAYFKIDGDESTEYDCCNTEKCTEAAVKSIQEKHGEDVEIEEIWTYNDSDHDSIDNCSVCGVPLNTQLTWVETELEYAEGLSNKEEIAGNAFTVYCVLDALPSNDEEIKPYSQNHPDRYKSAVKRLHEFYLRLSILTDRVITELSIPN